MFLSHKIEIRPTIDQIIYIEKCFGAKRHCYNNLLEWFSKPENKWSKSSATLRYKDTRPEWYHEISGRVTRNTIDDLDRAFVNFFNGIKNNKKVSFPKFKKKGGKESFSFRENKKFQISGKLLKVEKLKSRIKLRENVRFDGYQKSITFSKKANKYFVSVLVDVTNYKEIKENRKNSVGIDIGISKMAVLSDGVVYGANQKFKESEKIISKLNHKISKSTRGSNNRKKYILKLSKVYLRVSRQRKSFLDNLTDSVTKNYDRIVIEDLNVSGMIKNKSLSKYISDSGFGRFRLMLEYKSKLRNCELVIADRFFPSSKTCSKCGSKKDDLTLKDRLYKCSICGFIIDRDLNAAINLNNYNSDTFKRSIKGIVDE